MNAYELSVAAKQRKGKGTNNKLSDKNSEFILSFRARAGELLHHAAPLAIELYNTALRVGELTALMMELVPEKISSLVRYRKHQRRVAEQGDLWLKCCKIVL